MHSFDNVNTVTLAGRLGKDPMVKTVANGKTMTTFSLATSERIKRGEEYTDETQWHHVTCWGRVAERASNLAKGDHAVLIGSVKYRTYTDKDGVEKNVTTIEVNDFGGELIIPGTRKKAHAPAAGTEPGYNPHGPVTDDDIPF